MNKQAFLWVCCTILALRTVSAKEYYTDHFTVNSDLPPAYVRLVQANAEAYYANMQQQYFPAGWQKPLKIYYSKTKADTQKLLNDHGHYGNVDCARYEPDVPAVYTHQFANNQELNGWNTLFHQITCHFIHKNFQAPPEWFNEGLACFFRDHARIVRGKLVITEPDPLMLQMLKGGIEEGRRFNIKRLFSSSKEQLHSWSGGCQFAQALFYWLHENGRLKEYLTNARQKGYDIEVLEETLATSFGKINMELADFIEDNCKVAAHLHDGRQTRDYAQKQQAFLDALRLKPDCRVVCLELAECYYNTGDYENCRKHLNPIFNDPQSPQFLPAARLMAGTYYKQKDYTHALAYYNKAWEYANFYEYKYKVAYRIADCYCQLENPECAKKWFKEFLDCNWEPDKNKAGAEYARKFIECTTDTSCD
jgi:pentatricopeptide repeat protein